MSSRTDVDRPAMLVTAVIAVILIAVSAPFTWMWWGEGTTTYEVDWEEAEVGSDTLTVTQPGTANAQTANVRADDVYVSTVVVEFGACTDTPGVGGSPATINWALSVRHDNGTTETLGGGSYTCASVPSDQRVQRSDEPTGVGAREVESGDAETEREAARATLWDAGFFGGLNETSEYILTASATRPAGQLPGPLAQPSSISAAMTLTVDRWEALLQETGDDEVVR